MDRKYVYGIMKAPETPISGIPGIGGGVAYSLAEDGIACVLSDYAGREVSTLPKEEMVRYLLTHQAVVERVMESHTVLPMKFGTVVSGEAEAHAFLLQGAQRFAAVLAQLHDTVEMEVAATWDTAGVLRELAGREDIARASATLESVAPGQVFQGKMRLGQIVNEAMDERRLAYRERMLALLGPVALDLHPNILVSDRMVMNVAFLVHRGQLGQFDGRIRRLNDMFDDQIDFRVIGPLPPYSFATAEVTRLDVEHIESARRALELDEPLSELSVRRAYRRLAAENHPDVNKKGSSHDLARLREASEMLLAYCRGQASHQAPGASPANSANCGAQALLINVKRLGGEFPDSAGGLKGHARTGQAAGSLWVS